MYLNLYLTVLSTVFKIRLTVTLDVFKCKAIFNVLMH